MEIKCSICDSMHVKPLYDHKLKCQKCGHVFSDLYLTKQDEIAKLYNKNYFGGYEYHNYLADRKVLQKNFKLRLKILQNFLEPIRHKHLLEIGCAYGFFLDVAKDQFDTVTGIDIAENGIIHARKQLGLDAICGDFLKYDFGNLKFDVVCVWDTIEHLQSPSSYLQKISNHIKSGSLLAITTGDIESINARIRKGQWRLMRTPTHIHYFSKKILAKILYNYGFDIIYNRYCGFYRTIDTAAYRIFVLDKRWPELYNFLCRIGLTGADFYLNLHDIMYVIARKR